MPDERKVQFRIGVNSGDVIEDRGDIYGDGVNVAARLESLATPGGICLSDAVRTAVGKKLDLDYEDMGEVQVKNITEPVRTFRVLMDKKVERRATQTESAVVELPDKLSIAVLPFTNMSSDPEQEFFADGITEDIITALSRIPDLFVISRNSTFIYKGRAVRPDEVARDLGVRSCSFPHSEGPQLAGFCRSLPIGPIRFAAAYHYVAVRQAGIESALTNSPVHPTIGQDTLAIDIPRSLRSEEDTGLTDFFKGS